MRIIRVKNPVGIDYMAGHFDDLYKEEGIDIEVIKDGLKTCLMTDLDNTLVLQAWEGEELIAFLVALNVANYKHVFLDQAWSDPKNPPEVMDKLFFRLLMWVDYLGKKQIRLETSRNAEAMTRKWNFVQHSVIMKFDLSDTYESDYVALVRKSKEKNDIPKSGTS